MALKKNPKYDLKKHYKRVFEICLIVSLSFLIIAFKYFPEFENEIISDDGPQELLTVEDIVNTSQETAPPPPPKPPIPIEAPSDDVLDDIEISETELDVNEVVEAPPPPPKVENEDEGDPVFFVAVEEMPSPIGGIAAIEANITYPEIAIRAGVQGRVYLRAYVDEKGNVSKVDVLKGIGAGCDEAAIEAVLKAKFNPGRQRGKPVKVQVSLPIRFIITSN